MKCISLKELVVSLFITIMVSFTFSFLFITTTEAVDGTTTATVGNSTTITLPTSTVAFGTMSVNDNNDTTDDNPPPFTIQNDGSCNLNLTILATTLWDSDNGGNNTHYYRYNVSESEAGSLVNISSDVVNASWPYFTTNAITFVTRFKFNNSNDLLELDINVTVPPDEPAGAKSSTVTVTASQA